MRLRIGAMVCGFIGGIGGYIIGILGLIIGGMLGGGSEEFFGSETPTVILIASFPVSIMGVIGAAITLAKPGAGATLMLLSAVVMLFVGSAAGHTIGETFSLGDIGIEGVLPAIFSSVLLIIAGVLALFGRREET